MKKRVQGPRKQGRTFHHDVLRGEGNIPMDGLGPGKRRKREGNTRTTAGLTLGGGLPEYGAHPHGRGRTRKANAEPSGGGGGIWKEMNEKLAASRAKLRSHTSASSNAMALGGFENISGKGGLAYGVNEWVRDKTEEGDIEGGLSGNQSGTSIFDPVLCELIYRWFCPPGGLVLDPFAGGSVRGIVASKLGRGYLGIDLSVRQVEANKAQGVALCKAPLPRWLVGDSRKIDKIGKGQKIDLIFSCPPYADLEVYSEDERDLSFMPHPDFRIAYAEIIAKACELLKPDRFSCYVIGDARDERGLYYGLPRLTVDAFEAAGLRLYNDAVLLTAIGSLPVRVAKQFTASRKLGKTHQNVLVFVKGDPVKATQAIGEVEFGDVEGVESGPLQGGGYNDRGGAFNEGLTFGTIPKGRRAGDAVQGGEV